MKTFPPSPVSRLHAQRMESFARYASDRITSLEGEVVLWQRSHEALLRRQVSSAARLRLLGLIAVTLAVLATSELAVLFYLTRLSGR